MFSSRSSRISGEEARRFCSWLVNETEIGAKLESAGLDPKIIGKLAIGKLADKKQPYLDQIINSGIDVDKMDYVVSRFFSHGSRNTAPSTFIVCYTRWILSRTTFQ